MRNSEITQLAVGLLTTTVFLAGLVALAAAASSGAQQFLRQEKQKAASWWQSPSLQGLPVYGLVILALVAYNAYCMSGRYTAAALAPALAFQLVAYALVMGVALSVV